eukprot:Gb_17434 [translate_table: standard]
MRQELFSIKATISKPFSYEVAPNREVLHQSSGKKPHSLLKVSEQAPYCTVLGGILSAYQSAPTGSNLATRCSLRLQHAAATWAKCAAKKHCQCPINQGALLMGR